MKAVFTNIGESMGYSKALNEFESRTITGSWSTVPSSFVAIPRQTKWYYYEVTMLLFVETIKNHSNSATMWLSLLNSKSPLALTSSQKLHTGSFMAWIFTVEELLQVLCVGGWLLYPSSVCESLHNITIYILFVICSYINSNEYISHI